MKKGKRNSGFLSAGVAASLIVMGSFFMGIGFQRFFDNRKIRTEYQNSELEWKQELFEGLEEDAVRDLRNQALMENMQHVSMERQIFVEAAGAEGTAGISNSKESAFLCTLALIRDATGEIIYESGLIEPGYYIEAVRLGGELKKGYYPCTAVWSFYTEEEEYAGEAAWKIVVIIKN